MKSLYPNEQKSSTIVPNDYFASLRAELAELSGDITAINGRIAEINATLNNPTISKQSGHFTNVDVDNQITSNSVDVNMLDANEIDANRANIGIVGINSGHIAALTADDFTVNQLKADEGSITDLTTETMVSDSATITSITSDTVTAENVVGTNGSFSSLNADSFSIPSLTALTEVEAATTNTTTLNATNIDADNADIDNLDATGAVIDTLRNDKKIFDKSKVILTSTQNETPFYIKIPAFTTGTYRIQLNDPNDVFKMSVVIINSKDAPLISYTKDSEDALTQIIYDKNTKEWFLESYLLEGKLYWSADTYETVTSPVTMATIVETGKVHYACAAMKRVVVFGDGSAYYGLDVKGKLSADIMIDTSREGTPLFYSGSASGFIGQLDTYLGYGESVSLAGYMYDPVEETSYSIQTVSRATEEDGGGYTLYVENKEGVGTDAVALTHALNAQFGVFTTTKLWDQNIND